MQIAPMAPCFQHPVLDAPKTDRVHTDPTTGDLHILCRRSRPAAAFLVFFLVGWAVGGVQVLTGQITAFLLLWACMWAAGVVSVSLSLLGMLLAVDIIRITAGSLVITRRAGIIRRTWRYETTAIRNVRIDMQPWSGDGRDGSDWFVLAPQRWGTVRFDWHAVTVHLGSQLRTSEAAVVKDWIERRLAAVETRSPSP